MIVSFDSNVIKLMGMMLEYADQLVGVVSYTDFDNDFELPDTPENRLFCTEANLFMEYDDPEDLEIEGGSITIPDFVILRYLSHLCKKAIVPGE